ncbi:MAG: HAD family hydrolase [Planctomycetes bacterium]|nr:HAD family hydrolase [Planctomycetota bacterium]NOG55473.1 HAD family hydrolase [Planctomycetota bacterium]
MNIALDIDDTITRHPEFFAFLTASLRQAGHRIIILTFREDAEVTTADLHGWGIVFDELITSSLDLCLKHGVDEWKGAMCRQHNVDVFFEDDPDVLQHVDDHTMCLMPVDKNYHVLATQQQQA